MISRFIGVFPAVRRRYCGLMPASRAIRIPAMRTTPARSRCRLKQTIPSSGLAVFAKNGYFLNLEKPALFNKTLAGFLILAEANRWRPCVPASMRALKTFES